MDKAILINLDLLKISEYKNQIILDELRNELLNIAKDTNNLVCFYSMDNKNVKMAEEYYSKTYPNNDFIFKTRSDLEGALESHKDKPNHYVIIGKKDADFFMAIKYKILLIVPSWLTMEEKPEKYGVLVDNVKQLIMFINTLNNQNTWYSTINIDTTTTVFSLMDARYGYYAKDFKEQEMIENFQNLLKKGTSRSYYDILLYHFLSAMTNTTLFDDVKIWGIIPSSDCTYNEEMMNFKEIVRCIKNGRHPRNLVHKNLLIRHTHKAKAHMAKDDRSTYGAAKEFATIKVNPEFKKMIDKLRSENQLNVCVFDDYLTHGNTFESVRNLLKSLGATKIIFVSLGSFCSCYEKNDYDIIGNVYSDAYKFTHIRNTKIYKLQMNINDKAKDEIISLYNIFNN